MRAPVLDRVRLRETVLALIVDGIDASGHRFAPMPTIQNQEEEKGHVSTTTHDEDWAQWYEDYERRRKMESHVTSFVKHPEVYTSKLTHFLEERCGVDLVATARSSKMWRLSESDLKTMQEQEALRSDLDWWEGGMVGKTVRVTGVETAFPRPVASPPLWLSATRKDVADDCTAADALKRRLCRL